MSNEFTVSAESALNGLAQEMGSIFNRAVAVNMACILEAKFERLEDVTDEAIESAAADALAHTVQDVIDNVGRTANGGITSHVERFKVMSTAVQVEKLAASFGIDLSGTARNLAQDTFRG